MGKSTNKVILIGNIGTGAHIDYIASCVRYVTKGIYDNQPHGGNCISSGMAAGSLDVTGDVDCSDAPGADSTTTASSDDDDGGDADPEPARRRSTKEKSHKLKKAGRDGAHGQTKPQTSDDAGAQMAKTSISAKPHDATAMAGDLPRPPQDQQIALWRLPTVLAHVPVSRSGWWQGVKDGRYPQPVRLSARCVAWRSSDIRSLIESF